MHKVVTTGLVLAVLAASGTMAAASPHPATDVYDGWRVGVQAWSFNRFTLFEAIDMTRSLGLSWIQAYPGQKLAPDIDAGLTWELSDALRQQVKDKLAQANVRMVAFGVAAIPKDEAEARKLFAFAKDMGIEMIAAEPEFDQFDLIEKLAAVYAVKVGIHNHPKPSRYRDPVTTYKTLRDRSRWIGVCADVGHWLREGFDPVEALRLLEGRIFDIHMKEIDLETGRDVVWGTGARRTEGILKELHRQGFEGTFSIEYEDSWDNNVPLIRRCVAYFNTIASTLHPSGWGALFAADLSNADFPADAWQMEEGVLELLGGGDIWTKQRYGDFVLDFEFKVDKNTNSGVFLRTQDHNWLPWIEVQIADSYGRAVSRHICGAIFDVQAPSVNAVRLPGQWNRMTIDVRGSALKVALNNQRIIDIDLDDWSQAGKNPDGSANKFKVAYKDLPREGFIGFQDHRDGTKVWYRNLSVKQW